MKVVVAEQPTFKERTSKSSGRPYKLWTFKDVEGTTYEDVYVSGGVRPGDELDVTKSALGGWELVKSPEDSSRPPSKPAVEKVYKADPDKMRQEYSLEVARNQSIQRQVALKGVVELVAADKLAYTGIDAAFDHFMELLATQWVPKSEVPASDDDLPPVDLYDGLVEEEGAA